MRVLRVRIGDETMKKIYAVATESDVVLAFESKPDAEEYAG